VRGKKSLRRFGAPKAAGRSTREPNIAANSPSDFARRDRAARRNRPPPATMAFLLRVDIHGTSIYTCASSCSIMRREEKVKMKKSDGAAGRLRRRFERLAGRLAGTGWVLVGTIRPRWLPPRRGGSKKRLGPYYQWTFKEAGKTVTVNLSAAQVKPFQRAIDRQRKQEALLAQMRTISRQYLEATTHGVKRRKPPPPNALRP